LTAGSGRLKFVASEEAGTAGLNAASPVYCEWRWYYHVPSLALWGLIALALVVPKENRKPQAWLILIPLFLVMALWQMPARLFSLPPSAANPVGFMVNSVAMAWTVVWLLGRRLGSRRRIAAFFWMLGVMTVVGLWAYVGEYGTAISSDMLVMLIPYGVCALALLSSMALARLFCRKTDRPGPFMAWLFIWMGFGSMAGMLLFAVIMTIASFNIFMLLMVLISAAFAALFLTVLLYLGNLPFMLLAFKSPFYRERFRSTFGLEPKSSHSPFAEPSLATPATPTTVPEDVYDPAGREA